MKYVLFLKVVILGASLAFLVRAEGVAAMALLMAAMAVVVAVKHLDDNDIETSRCRSPPPPATVYPSAPSFPPRQLNMAWSLTDTLLFAISSSS